jgi:hypothetical protein
MDSPKSQLKKIPTSLCPGSGLTLQNNLRIPQETQAYLRDAKMGKILGMAYLVETAATRQSFGHR